VERRSLVLAVCWDRDSWNDSAMVGDEARVVQAFCVWLAEHGWHTQLEVHVDVVADRGNQRLYAEAKGRTAALGLDVDTLYGQLLRRMPTDQVGRPCSPSLCRTQRSRQPNACRCGFGSSSGSRSTVLTMSVQSITPGRVPILLTKVEPEDGRLLLAKHSVDANRDHHVRSRRRPRRGRGVVRTGVAPMTLQL
jgi:hypothetical protein